MKVLWAMDLIGGKAVRLSKGDFERMTVYSEDPVATVGQMVREGAKDFHLIDLDGARTGTPIHRELIKAMRAEVTGYLETGGGIRTTEDIVYYEECGMDGIIIGTRALTDAAFFEGLAAFHNIILGLDMYEGKIMVRGWKEAAPVKTKDVLDVAERIGVKALLCTNIARDGMLTGPDYEGMRKMKSMTGLPLIASGGLSTAEELRRLKEMGVWAAIVGKAFYEGRGRVEEAMQHAD
jgi:phosphoribosylformimino-5-aminoimidazole carboxamide ribotide isomerase